MWIGATKGFAGLKFSTSPSKFGAFDDIKIIKKAIMIMGIESLIENNGLNLILSKFVYVEEGFDEPFSWSRIKWTIASITISMGKRKWSEKNRFNVGCDTDGPPQIHVTRSFPTKGIAERTPVITVAPQKDICPHGSTYPKKAVAITANRITTPDNQIFLLFAGEEK